MLGYLILYQRGAMESSLLMESLVEGKEHDPGRHPGLCLGPV